MRTTWKVLVALGLVIAVGAPAAAQQEIKIGFTISTSGTFARAAEPVRRGILLYEDWVNKQGGIMVKDAGKKLPVKMVFYDDESNKDNVLRLYERLAVQDKVDFFLAPYSSPLTITAASMADKYKKVMVSHTGSSTIIYTQGFQYIVQSVQPTPIYMRPIFELAKARFPQDKKVAIVYEDTPFPKGVAEFGEKTAKELGFDLVVYDKFPFKAADVSPVLTKVKAANPDILVWMANEEATVLGLRQMKELDVNAKLVAVLDASLYSFLKALGAKDLEGVSGFIEWDPNVNYRVNYGPNNEQFLKMYEAFAREKFKDTDPPDNHTPLGLVSGLLIQAAIEKAGTLDSTKVRAAMNDLNVTTLVGPFKIDKTGLQQGYPMLTTQWQKGKSVVVWPAQFGTPDRFIYPMPAWKDKR
jgi:branched-chain amino acid transport system substrate-binding protein